MSRIHEPTGATPLERFEPRSELTAFEQLFRQHYLAVVRATIRVVGSRQEAEEIAAEAFSRLHREKTEVPNQVGWLKQCAIRVALDSLRAAVRRRKREVEVPLTSSPVDSPEVTLWLAEQKSQVRQVLAELSVRDAELLLQRADGFSYQEIAGNLKIHPGSVGKLLARAEDKFSKRYVARYGQE